MENKLIAFGDSLGPISFLDLQRLRKADAHSLEKNTSLNKTSTAFCFHRRQPIIAGETLPFSSFSSILFSLLPQILFQLLRASSSISFKSGEMPPFRTGGLFKLSPALLPRLFRAVVALALIALLSSALLT